MARVAAIASLVVIGVIIADLVAHPAATAQIAGSSQYITKPAFNALLGQPS
jgi:hypothetical protein